MAREIASLNATKRAFGSLNINCMVLVARCNLPSCSTYLYYLYLLSDTPINRAVKFRRAFITQLAAYYVLINLRNKYIIASQSV